MKRFHASTLRKAALAALGSGWLVLQGAAAWAAPVPRYLEVGRTLVERGEMADGLRLVAAAVALNPGDAQARALLLATLDGPCCNQDIGLHAVILPVLPHDPDLLDRLAGLYEHQARFLAAAALRMRDVPLSPDDPEYHARMFLYFELVGDMEHARRCFARYTALGGHRAEILDRAPGRPAPFRGS
jgi:hypothetical protein